MTVAEAVQWFALILAANVVSDLIGATWRLFFAVARNDNEWRS